MILPAKKKRVAVCPIASSVLEILKLDIMLTAAHFEITDGSEGLCFTRERPEV